MSAFEAPKLLYAICKDAQAEQESALGGQYSVEYVYTTERANARVATLRFELILSGIHFDDCQMGPFLQYCKNNPLLRDTPFLCVRGIKGTLPERHYWRARYFAEAMGARYFDYQAMAAEEGHSTAGKTLCELIASCLIC